MLKNGELTIIKKNSLVQDFKVKDLSVTELRIINYLIANIDSAKYDKEFREFKFAIKEFYDIIYPGKDPGARYDRLPEIIKNLADKSAWKEIPSERNPGKMKQVLIRWIEKPEFDNGTVILKLDKDLAPYLLEVDKNYFEAQFKYTALAQSRYTIPLYELLKSWEKVAGHKKTFEVMELREYMDATEKSKDNIAEFKRRALDIALKEINEITDLLVSYTEIKKGRKTTHIEFTILSKNQTSGNAINVESTDIPKAKRVVVDTKTLEFCKDLLKEYNFDDTQVKKIIKAAYVYVPDNLPSKSPERLNALSTVIKEKIAAYDEYANKHIINNVFRTFYSAISGNWKANNNENAVKEEGFSLFSEVPVFKPNKSKSN